MKAEGVAMQTAMTGSDEGRCDDQEVTCDENTGVSDQTKEAASLVYSS